MQTGRRKARPGAVMLGCWDKDPTYADYLDPGGRVFLAMGPGTYSMLVKHGDDWSSTKAFLATSARVGRYFQLTGPSLRSPSFRVETDYLISLGNEATPPYRLLLGAEAELGDVSGPMQAGLLSRMSEIVPIKAWFDHKRSGRAQQQFEKDVREHLGFLFTDHGARVLANEPEPPFVMDLAKLTLGLEGLCVAITRGRGEHGAFVATEAAPLEWFELSVVLRAAANSQDNACVDYYGLRGIAGLFWEHLGELKELFINGDFHRLRPAALDVARQDEQKLLQLEEKINQGLYGQPVTAGGRQG